jgi:hypothetical protein
MLSYFGETRKECAEVFLESAARKTAASVAPAATRFVVICARGGSGDDPPSPH